jgi:hypothetical protein
MKPRCERQNARLRARTGTAAHLVEHRCRVFTLRSVDMALGFILAGMIDQLRRSLELRSAAHRSQPGSVFLRSRLGTPAENVAQSRADSSRSRPPPGHNVENSTADVPLLQRTRAETFPRGHFRRVHCFIRSRHLSRKNRCGAQSSQAGHGSPRVVRCRRQSSRPHSTHFPPSAGRNGRPHF